MFLKAYPSYQTIHSLNEQVRQQTGKVSLPAVKKLLADNEQFQAILDQNHGMMQQAYNKYLAANTKVNDLTRQQQSKQISWLMNKPKKQFLGCVAKHTPPEYKIIPYSGLRNSAYEKELNAGHTNRATVLKPPPGMKIQHLPKGIREYVSRNPSEFKDYLDEISAETKYLSTISRLVKKETGPDARDRIRRKILQAAEDTGLFEKELTTYNNKKQCVKMNNKRYEERLQELLEEKEKEYAAEVKRVKVECTSKTMSLELQLEEMLKTIEQKDKFITKQMMVQQAGKSKRNTTLKAHPHALISLCLFCVKHALGTQKLTNVLQRIYKLFTGSNYSVYLINWTKLRSTITARQKRQDAKSNLNIHLEPCEVLETLQQKIWRIKIETHCERGTKQTTEQRPEKKPDLLNMDGNDVTRAVTYWMTTCLRARPQQDQITTVATQPGVVALAEL
ncbi:hypothetical protein PROFUN_16554 [Planoprotostelium fungivorum]|uniref:Uncharacterized protein n=1 Tax=Planoprotostelium fungivorum TaxID=1890364 RepID=A0A2P6MPU3_9EUKA|nr:hypothetical protein PROFUN_16554 [Planoprotostelium fungivorum]